MENEIKLEEKSVLEKLLDYKAPIFIFTGIAIRIFMLIYYYYIHAIDPSRGWGDVELNFIPLYVYPPLSMILLEIFIVLSFGSVEVFAFWAFFFDMLITLMFYFVIKSFKIPKKEYVFGLFLINPFLFLNNVFSLDNCGYHITDSFFFIFLFLSLIFYPRKEIKYRYLFYFFLSLSIITKWYPLPAVAFFFLKYLIEKDWREMKIFLISVVPILFSFLILPFLFWENYINIYLYWENTGVGFAPIYIKIIPIAIISIFFLIFRLKKADPIEITFVSIVAMVSFMFFSVPFIRYFQPLIFYGILKTKEFFTISLDLKFIKRKIIFDNNLLVFYLSIAACGLAYLMIIFVLDPFWY